MSCHAMFQSRTVSAPSMIIVAAPASQVCHEVHIISHLEHRIVVVVVIIAIFSFRKTKMKFGRFLG